MGKNRDRISLVAAILEAANPRARKTHIMQKANLSFSVLEKYLGIAVQAGLVQVESSEYLLTERGRVFLNQYKLLEERYVKAQELLEFLVWERERLSRFFEGRKLLESSGLL